MKKIILCVVLVVFSLGFDKVYAQALKLRTNAYASRLLDEGKWTQWSEWSNANILIQIVNDRVTIFSKEIQIFDIMRYYDKIVNDEGDSVFSYKCTDKEGVICVLKFINAPRDSSKYSQLYIRYSNYNYVYEISFLD